MHLRYVNALDFSIFKDIENTSCKNNNWVVLMVRMNWNTTAYAICFGHFCALLGQLG